MSFKQQTGERSQRYESIMKIEYKYKGRTYIDLVDNISPDGLFIATPAPLPVKAHIELFLYPVGKNIPIVLTGEVRWIRTRPEKNKKRGMGIAFLNDNQKVLVAKMLAETGAATGPQLLQDIASHGAGVSSSLNA